MKIRKVDDKPMVIHTKEKNPFHVYSKKVKAGSGLEYREIFKLIGGTEVCTYRYSHSQERVSDKTN